MTFTVSDGTLSKLSFLNSWYNHMGKGLFWKTCSQVQYRVTFTDVTLSFTVPHVTLVQRQGWHLWTLRHLGWNIRQWKHVSSSVDSALQIFLRHGLLQIKHEKDHSDCYQQRVQKPDCDTVGLHKSPWKRYLTLLCKCTFIFKQHTLPSNIMSLPVMSVVWFWAGSGLFHRLWQTSSTLLWWLHRSINPCCLYRIVSLVFQQDNPKPRAAHTAVAWLRTRGYRTGLSVLDGQCVENFETKNEKKCNNDNPGLLETLKHGCGKNETK